MSKKTLAFLLSLCLLLGALPLTMVSAANGATSTPVDTFDLADGTVVTVTKHGSKEGKINTDEDIAAVQGALPAETNLLALSTTTHDVPTKSIYGRSLANMFNGSVTGNGHWIENPNKDVLLVFDLHVVAKVDKFFLSTEAGWNGYSYLNNVEIYLSADVAPTADTLSQCTLVHTVNDNNAYAWYAARTVTLSKPIAARYIAFKLGSHNYLGGYDTPVTAIGELGVYGTMPFVGTGATANKQDTYALDNDIVLTVNKYTVDEVAGSLPTEENLLNVNRLTTIGTVSCTNGRNKGMATDGSIGTSGMTAAHFENSKDGVLVYDLGAVGKLDKMYLCSAQDHQRTSYWYWIMNTEVYFSNSVPTAENLGTLIYRVSDGGSTASYPTRLLTFSEPVEARYVVIKLGTNGGNNSSWIGEVGAYGTMPFIGTGATTGVKDTFGIGDDNVLTVEKYTKEQVATSLPADDNLLKSENLTMTGASLTNGRSRTHLTDGNIGTSGNTAAHFSNSVGGTLTYNLGSTVALEKLYLCSGQDWNNNDAYWMYGIEVYLSETAPTANNLGTKVYTIDDNSNVAKYPTRLLTFTNAIKAQYVTFKLANNGLNNYILIGELGAYAKKVVAPVTNKGAQIRDYEEDATKQDIRFGFDVVCSGMAYVEDSYVGDYTAAKIVIDDVTYPVLEMGALASAMTSEKADLVAVGYDNTKVNKVKAVNFYAIEDEQVTFTVVALGVPAAYYESDIAMRSYVAYDDNGTTRYAYGDVITRTVQSVLEQADY